MTFTPEKDFAEHVRFIAEYEDGTTDVFAIPECSLNQGPMPIARTVAREWQTDGRPTVHEFFGDVRPNCLAALTSR